MSLQVTISRCSDCGWQGTPKRLWCPDCGTDQVREVAAESGRVAEITTVGRSAGREPAHVRIASVEVDGGGMLIARLPAPAALGAHVRLVDDHGAPVAEQEGDSP